MLERAKATPSLQFITNCEDALRAAGKLLPLLADAQRERDTARQARADARRKARQAEADPALRYEADSDAGEDLGPTNRRDLLGAGAAALGVPLLGVGAVPMRAGEVDPELPEHLDKLLRVLDRHDAMFGPDDVLGIVLRELVRISACRDVARGELRTRLLRVEADWTEFAAFLSNDTGAWGSRSTLTDRTLQLAQESNYADMIALARMRQSQWAVQERDARRAIDHANAALDVRGTSEQTRARCLLRAAHGHAQANDAAACERSLAAAFEHSDVLASAPGSVTPAIVRANEARCWLWMQPAKAVGLYERALREYPPHQMRDRGLHRARLALACAASGERDRAEAEGRKALAIAQATNSATAFRELKRLGVELNAA